MIVMIMHLLLKISNNWVHLQLLVSVRNPSGHQVSKGMESSFREVCQAKELMVDRYSGGLQLDLGTPIDTSQPKTNLWATSLLLRDRHLLKRDSNNDQSQSKCQPVHHTHQLTRQSLKHHHWDNQVKYLGNARVNKSLKFQWQTH